MIGWQYVIAASTLTLALGAVIGWYVAKKHIVRAGGDMSHLFMRAVGAFLVILAIASIVQISYFQQEQATQSRELRNVSDCQYRVNKALLDALASRQDPSKDKDQALTDMVLAVLNAKSREDSRKALKDFIAATDKLNATRTANPYPTVPADCRPS